MNLHTIITCPMCGVDNHHEYWDEHTRATMDIPEGHDIISSKASKEEHEQQESQFNCPTCNKIIPGVKLINNGEVGV